jgi:uncharacterized protein
MKIDVQNIPASGLSLDITEEGDAIEAVAGGEGRLGFRFLTPVSMHIDVMASGMDVNVSGRIRVDLIFACARCLKDFERRVDSDFFVFYTREKEEGRKERELKAPDLEVIALDSDTIDTQDIILQQLALEAPIKPLCLPECKGLCQRCGSDLNLGVCACAEAERVDPRLAKLRGFKVDSPKG